MDDTVDRRKHQIPSEDAHCCWCRCQDDASWRHVDVHGCRQLSRRGWRRCFWLVVLLTSLGGFFVAISNDLWPLVSPKLQSVRYHGNRVDLPIYTSSSSSSPNSFGFYYSRVLSSTNDSTPPPQPRTTTAATTSAATHEAGEGRMATKREIGLTVCNLNPLRISNLAKHKWPLVYDLPHHATILKEVMTTSGDVISGWEKVNVSSHFVFNRAGHAAEEMIISCSSDADPCSPKNFTPVHSEWGLCQRIETKEERHNSAWNFVVPKTKDAQWRTNQWRTTLTNHVTTFDGSY